MPSVYDALSAKPRSLDDMRRYCDEVPGHKKEGIADFAHLQEIIGFPEYYEMERRYASS